jgi:branched-chain amino acid transport system substrate-binding protein
VKHQVSAWIVSMLLLLGPGGAAATALQGPPVMVGLDGEFTLDNSTSAQAIELGIRVAMTEINESGGVLGGRPLVLITRDNRSNPSRGVANLKELAAMPDLVAVFGGRFSPVVTELVKPAHELKVVLLAPWSSATGIVANGYQPNYVFRLSASDRVVLPAMIDHARAQGHTRLGLMVGNTAWGRSGREAAELHVASTRGVRLIGVEVHNTGDETLVEQYRRLVGQGADAVLLQAADSEAVHLVRGLAALDKAQRVPIVSHWGQTGSRFFAMAGADSLARLDLSVVQTFSLFKADPRKAGRVMAGVRRLGGSGRIEDVPSPVGFGHAYDLTHILARAVDLAGSTDRARVRDALERVRSYDGLVRRFDPPFTPARHEALQRADLFFARYRADGALVPVGQRPLAAKQGH